MRKNPDQEKEDDISLQLVLGANSITVHAMLVRGVLASQTFSGKDCYARLVGYLKQISENHAGPIKADIILEAR